MDRRAVTALLLAGGLIATGCGGDDDEAPPNASGPSGDRAVTSAPDGGPSPEPEAHDDEHGSEHEHSKGRGLEDLSPRERTKSVRLVVESVAGFNDLVNPRITVSADGHRVGIAVAPKVACAAKPDAASRTATQLKEQLKIVRVVTVTVGRRTFAAHRAGCRTPILPGGSGRVVYSQDGTGIIESRPFKVTAKRWTLAYRGDRYLSIFVFKNGKAETQVIRATDGASGKRTYGGPGTIKLRITGSGPWAVTVRDGA
jgi:hypothetical protein